MKSKLEDVVAGVSLDGPDPGGPVEVVAVTWHGTQAITVALKNTDGINEQMLFRSDEGTFRVLESTAQKWSFDGDGNLFRLAAEARRIHLAHLFDPYVALSSSAVDALPHQIEAVYGEMIPRQPLRFLLADDPGAGKTVMAGLYIKELMIRGDVERALIVAPGSLSLQWQEEMREKFNLRFDILTKNDLDNLDTVNVFEEKPLLIARIDQIARRGEELAPVIERSDWDLVVVDEAHRMSAHFFGDEIKQTLRYRLGVMLGRAARHLLLMTATPHNGKEEDFQLFLALLDSDRFAGKFRDGVHAIDPSSLMRRMVKERLVTFEGKPLFPERRSYSVTYGLSPEEMRLYDEVTAYVREQMNAADRLRDEGQGRRGNTVGFALTMLQRRLASSPEAIFQSLRRRRKRLEQRVIDERAAARAAALGFPSQQERLSRLLDVDAADRIDDDDDFANTVDIDAYDDLDDDEKDEVDSEVVDAATAAATIAELENEIGTLKLLEQLAFDLRESGVDRKWQELSTMLSESPEMFTTQGDRRKLIVFTEHRDTLNYLVDRLRTFLGSEEAVVHISGSTTRDERRVIQQTFTQDKNCLVLVATDAAGEGINLQRAHLVVNYDLPWNPNRIEQRFGRVHRIGQTEVGHMWNLVADDTRESQVYLRLLTKLEQMRETFDGQVYDVLGEALSGRELRSLLLDAIRYGDLPEVRARINQVIEHDVEARVVKAINEPVLAAETIGYGDVDRIRKQMEEASLRRLQPHYIQSFFLQALKDCGGKLREREPGRFELEKVPAAVLEQDRRMGTTTPLPRAYERITFEKELQTQEGTPIADLIAPGHPLLDAIIDLTLDRHRHQFVAGAIMIDESDSGTTPRTMVMLEHEVADARPTKHESHTVVSRRFEFIEIPENGQPITTGYAPYLDYRAPTDDERARCNALLNPALASAGVETRGLDHAVEVAIPEHLAQVRLRTETRVDETEAAVHERLTKEINYWDNRAAQLQIKVEAGKMPAINAQNARRRADELASRLKLRKEQLAQERSIKALPPKVVGGVLVVPQGLLDVNETGGDPGSDDVEARRVIEQRAVAAVIADEAAAGWHAVDMNTTERNHPGYDIRSEHRDNNDQMTAVRYIEVKGRIAGADTVTVSRNEILTSLNEPDKWVLALVKVHPGQGEEIRYLHRPFEAHRDGIDFAVTSVNFNWNKLWASGNERPTTS